MASLDNFLYTVRNIISLMCSIYKGNNWAGLEKANEYYTWSIVFATVVPVLILRMAMNAISCFLAKGGYGFGSVCLFVCLYTCVSVCLQAAFLTNL